MRDLPADFRSDRYTGCLDNNKRSNERFCRTLSGVSQSDFRTRRATYRNSSSYVLAGTATDRLILSPRFASLVIHFDARLCNFIPLAHFRMTIHFHTIHYPFNFEISRYNRSTNKPVVTPNEFVFFFCFSLFISMKFQLVSSN